MYRWCTRKSLASEKLVSIVHPQEMRAPRNDGPALVILEL